MIYFLLHTGNILNITSEYSYIYLDPSYIFPTKNIGKVYYSNFFNSILKEAKEVNAHAILSYIENSSIVKKFYYKKNNNLYCFDLDCATDELVKKHSLVYELRYYEAYKAYETKPPSIQMEI